MDYVIHRGKNEIGGMCIEVSSDSGTQILLDLGMPLVTPDGGDYPPDTPQRDTADLIEEGVLRQIPGLYADDPGSPAVSAIVVTHAHLDHYGLTHHAHPEIPVYGSEGTLAILDAGRVFFPDASLPAILKLLPLDEPLQIEDITVTAIPVDHAAPDSRALLVEADGVRYFYTGDLRAHGRTGFRFEKILKDQRLHNVDCLFVEGTTLGSSGGSHGLKSESDVEEELVSLAADNPQKLITVVASGQNLDRLVSCFRAARRAGRLLVIDPYQAYILHKLAPLSDSIPQYTWDGVRVYFSQYQVGRLKDAGLMELVYDMNAHGKATSDQLAAEPQRYLMCARGSYGMTKLFDKIGPDRVVLAWSMWSGYWQRDGCMMRQWAEREEVRVRFVHSGGHAWPEDLDRLIKAISAREVELVHTDCASPVLPALNPDS